MDLKGFTSFLMTISWVTLYLLLKVNIEQMILSSNKVIKELSPSFSYMWQFSSLCINSRSTKFRLFRWLRKFRPHLYGKSLNRTSTTVHEDFTKEESPKVPSCTSCCIFFFFCVCIFYSVLTTPWKESPIAQIF